jgi:hypothetical protein
MNMKLRAGKADAADAVERASSRPDFIILGYAWLNAMKPEQQGVPGYCGLMKVAPEKCKSFEQYSPDSRVSAPTPLERTSDRNRRRRTRPRGTR